MEEGMEEGAQESGGGNCEIGSLEMPPAEWLFSAAASFQHNYGQVHPYLAAALCIAGTAMNLVTVLVLTRPSMRSPVNVLLCAVACCDIIVESSYLVFVLHFLLASAQRCQPSDFNWAWALFMIIHAHASVIFHAASIWMTVSLAQIRVLTIRRATTGPTTPLITERFTAILALLTTLAMVAVNVPNFLTFEIMEVPASAMLPCWQPPEIPPAFPPTVPPSTPPPPTLEEVQNWTKTTMTNGGQKGEKAADAEREIGQLIANLTGPLLSTIGPMLIGSSRTRRQHRLMKRFRRAVTSMRVMDEEPMVYTVRAHESDCMKLKLAFWSNGMIFKVIPCLLLTLSIVALLRIIADVAHKRKNLAQVMRKKVPKDHTTPMLAAILLIFLLTELPQGVFLVLNGIFSSESFHKRVYLPLGDLMDLLSLLNSAVGFLIYVGMSRKFRTVFLQLLFSALSCVFNKAPCSGISAGESTDGDKSWRRTSASQQLFHSGFHHSEQQPNGEQNAILAKHAGGGNGGREGKGGGGGWKKGGGNGREAKTWKGARKDGWKRWRKLSRNTRSTELTGATSRTEQLSLCPSSLLGLPPLTLAVSCSAGITAAAASVGVQLLQLDPPPPSSPPPGQHHRQHSPERLSTFSTFLLPTLPNTNKSPTDAFRRPSSESQNGIGGGSQQYLDVPGGRPASSSILLTGKSSTKRASFLSLRDEKGEPPLGGQQRSVKRISFNLPPFESKMDENGRPGRSRTLTNGDLMGTGGSRLGIGQRLRRSFLLSLTAGRRGESAVEEEGESRGADTKVGEEEEESMMEKEDQKVPLNAMNGHCSAVDESNCPGKALLKLQRQGSVVVAHHHHGGRGKLSSVLARALLGRLMATTEKGRRAEEEEEEKLDSTGSGSPQRKLCTLRAETNFNGWAAYC